VQTELMSTVQHIVSGGRDGACSTYREQNAQMFWWGYLKQSNSLVELAMNRRISGHSLISSDSLPAWTVIIQMESNIKLCIYMS